MLKSSQLRDYQKKAVIFQCSKPESMLWLDMGLGKTIISLTSVQHLIEKNFLKAVLIVAPIRVTKLVWRQEAKKWTHTQGLTFSMITGTRDQRIRGLLTKADVYLINYENLEWLSETLHNYFIKKKKEIPFDGIIWDEVSKCKNSTTNRVKATLKIINCFKWATGLTGTPAANGYKDLHGQYLVVDKGKRLGTGKTAFRHRFYYKAGPYKEVPFPDSEQQIKELIGDITLEMSAADYNPLPDLMINDILIELPPSVRIKYDKLELELFAELDNGLTIEVFNKSSLINKCLQFSNGAVYPVSGSPEWEPIHDLKLEALEDIIEEANGNPVLCAYNYRSDAERIMTKFKHLNPINLTNCKKESELINAMSRWKNHQCQLMIGHPASMGHGIDGLQDNGNILVWYGLNYSLELYNQFNARLRRQGQGKPVTCHRILGADTWDIVQRTVLFDKEYTESSLRKCINDYRKAKYG